MDPELIAYLDAQFASVRGDLGGRIDAVEVRLGAEAARLDGKIDGVESRLDTKIDGVESRLDVKIGGVESRLDAKIDGVESRLDAKIDGVESRLEAKIESSAVETRRHFDVVMEQVQANIGILAEGVQMVDEKGDRRYAEIRSDLATLDRRVTRLEARRPPRRRRPRR